MLRRSGQNGTFDANCTGRSLCDLGLGQPELGYVSLRELAEVRGPLGLPLERDLHFAPTRTIAAYAEQAREHRRIVA